MLLSIRFRLCIHTKGSDFDSQVTEILSNSFWCTVVHNTISVGAVPVFSERIEIFSIFMSYCELSFLCVESVMD